jgi:virginiamycin B lyase
MVVGAAMVGVGNGSEAFAATGDVTEFAVSSTLTPALEPVRVAAGPDGNVWFTGTRTISISPSVVDNRIGFITPAGQATTYRLPAGSDTGDLTVGPDGNAWFLESGANRIGRCTPGGAITSYPIPSPDAMPTSIVAGPDGALWFTEYGPANQIGRITTAGVVTEFPLPNPDSLPRSITAGPDGALWFIEGAHTIGRITTAGVITEFPITGTGSYGIVTGPDGAIWFDEYNAIGRITTSGTVTTFPVPTSGGYPVGITVGADGNLWFVVNGADNYVGRMTVDGQFTRFNTPQTGTDVSTYGASAAADGNVWFAEPGAKRIAQVSVAPKPIPTLSLTPSRASVTYSRAVTITAQLSTAGSTGLVRIYQHTFGATASTLIASGNLNAQGSFAFKATPSITTSYVAQFTGDSTTAPARSVTVTIPVRRELTNKQSGYYGTSGKYRLYHYTSTCGTRGRGCPTNTVTVRPIYAGHKILLTLQHHTSSGWRTIATHTFRLNRRSRVKVIVIYGSTSVRGKSYRESASTGANYGYLPNTSTWAYFRIT